MPKVAFHTLGCKVNQYETNAMIQAFLKKGYELVDFDELADVYVVNTCTVTSISDKKSRQMLRRVKQRNPKSIIVATGCYAQIASKELEKIDELDIIIGNNEKKDILKYVEEYQNTKKSSNSQTEIDKISEVSKIENSKEFLEYGSVQHLETTRAIIKIQDGCNNFCSYCIIPYARGRIRSRSKEKILAEITDIVKHGIKEVVLTGIHIGSYGMEQNNNYYLIDLVEDINKINGLQRIRLGSLEPRIVTEEFCERLQKVDKICEHFHLSLQSGCDATLKRMNRKYTIEEFRNCVNLLRKTFTNVNLTADLIVGFPGETEEEFEQTYKFLEEIKFFKVHVFQYSRRNGTIADKMDNQVCESVKQERSKKIIALTNSIEQEYLKEYINKNVEVLFEEEKGGIWRGHTKNYIIVNVESEKNLENMILEIEIENLRNLELIGKLRDCK